MVTRGGRAPFARMAMLAVTSVLLVCACRSSATRRYAIGEPMTFGEWTITVESASADPSTWSFSPPFEQAAPPGRAFIHVTAPVVNNSTTLRHLPPVECFALADGTGHVYGGWLEWTAHTRPPDYDEVRPNGGGNVEVLAYEVPIDGAGWMLELECADLPGRAVVDLGLS